MKYIVRAPKVAAEKPPLIILLHGAGSNENALFSFAEQLPGQFLVVSVRAPHVPGASSFVGTRLIFRLVNLYLIRSRKRRADMTS